MATVEFIRRSCHLFLLENNFFRRIIDKLVYENKNYRHSNFITQQASQSEYTVVELENDHKHSFYEKAIYYLVIIRELRILLGDPQMPRLSFIKIEKKLVLSRI